MFVTRKDVKRLDKRLHIFQVFGYEENFVFKHFKFKYMLEFMLSSLSETQAAYKSCSTKLKLGP